MTTQIIESNPLNFFSYNDKSVRVFGTSDNPLFMGKDVAEILNYRNTRQAIISNIDIEDRFLLKNKRVNPIDTLQNKNIHPHSVLINESGLYTLIFRSNKPEALKFRKWVTKQVLPSIRKTGNYTIQPTKKSQQQISLDLVEQATNIFDKLGWDDQTRLLLKDFSKQAFLGNNGSLAEIKNQNQEWSISRRLSEHFGVVDKASHKKCSSFGRIMVSTYKEIYLEPPPTREQYVQGTIRRVNCYYKKHYDDFGDELMIEYFNIKGVELVEDEDGM